MMNTSLSLMSMLLNAQLLLLPGSLPNITLICELGINKRWPILSIETIIYERKIDVLSVKGTVKER